MVFRSHASCLLLGLFLAACSSPSTQGTDTGGDVFVPSDTGSDSVIDDVPDPDTTDVGLTEDVGEEEDTYVEPDLGPPADPKVCTGTTSGSLQPFGGACCYTDAGNPDNPDCVWYSDNYDDGKCLSDQCGEGYCTLAKYCTKGCSFLIDQSNNHTGATEADGVQDASLPDECGLAADGPYGAEFHCINVNPPFQKAKGRCRPGTTFKPCESSADCPNEESCQLLYILGETQGRCMAAHQDAVGLAEGCNSDPNSSDLVPCRGPFCRAWGCTELCDGDASCLTDTCEAGACTKSGIACASNMDCSALDCLESKPWASEPFSDTFCEPRDCTNDAICADPDWFCRPYWNGADFVDDVAYSPECRKRVDGAAKAGEACGAAGNTEGLPECSYTFGCINGICSAPCVEADDCPGDLDCFLGNSWNIDVDDDDVADTYLNLDLCQAWPHEGDLSDCTQDQDCPQGEHCQYRVQRVDSPDGATWEAAYKCRTDHPDQVGPGEVCGGSSGGVCGSDLCLVPSSASDGTPSLCTQTCSAAADCPETYFHDGFTWKTLCVSFNVNKNESMSPTDDVYVGYCWITSAIASLSSCEETKSCDGGLEYCRANAIAGNPDEPVNVEHLCQDYSQGLDAIPTKGVGEACSSWTECKGRRCMPDTQGSSYCSELCATDNDCQNPDGIAGLKCTEEVILERPLAEHSGTTTRCILAEECMACSDNNDCGGAFICMNIGGLGALANMRCAEPCSAESACSNAGLNCVEAIDGSGTFTGSQGCMPQGCE